MDDSRIPQRCLVTRSLSKNLYDYLPSQIADGSIVHIVVCRCVRDEILYRFVYPICVGERPKWGLGVPNPQTPSMADELRR